MGEAHTDVQMRSVPLEQRERRSMLRLTATTDLDGLLDQVGGWA